MNAERILLFIPAYRCAPQITRVVEQLPALAGLVDEVVVVDNRSPDDTVQRATEALAKLEGMRWRVLRNDDNYGLGGSHKVAIQHGRSAGMTWLLVLHGDDQADVRDIVGLLRRDEHRELDALLGARFQRGARLSGYSRVRTIGNHAYNLLFSLAGRKRFHDLGSGLNLFRLERFDDGTYLRFADDLTFNYHLSLHMARARWRMRFFPISWREEDQRSNVNLVGQGVRTLRLLGSFARDPDCFLSTDHRPAQRSYSARVVASSDPAP